MFGLGIGHNLSHYWLPGEDGWSDAIDCGRKREGLAVSIRGETEVVAMFHKENKDILVNPMAHYNGTTMNKNKWPRLMDNNQAVAFKSVGLAWDEGESFYVLGGETATYPLNTAYKFDIKWAKWTRLDDMPLTKGPYPSCGRATYGGRPSVICMGTEISQSNNIEILDLQSESWSYKMDVLTPANPPTYGSLMFSRGSRLYRVRGFYANGTATNSFDVLNLDTLTWDLPVALEPSDVKTNKLVLIDTE